MRERVQRKKTAARFLAVLLVCSTVFFSAFSCAAPAKKIKITIGMWPDPLVSSTAEIQLFEEYKKRFEQDYPQYEIVAAPYVYNESTVTAKAASGQLPVVFQGPVFETNMLARAGYIALVSSELAKLGWADKMQTDFLNMLTVRDGIYGEGIYGMPAEGSAMGMVANLSMLYEAGAIGKNPNGSYRLYDEGGWPLYPQTFSEVGECARNVVESGNGDSGLILLSEDTWGGRQLCNLIWNFGGAPLQLADAGGTWISRLNSIQAIRAVDWIRDLARENLVVRSPAYLSYPDWYTQFGSGAVAMTFCENTALGLAFQGKSLRLSDVGFFPMPFEADDAYTMRGGTAYFFSAKAQLRQIRGALLFLRYMGKSPETDAESVMGMTRHYETLQSMQMPVLPTIYGWSDPNFLKAAAELEEAYINIPAEQYWGFFESYARTKRDPEPHVRAQMYGLLDNVIQQVLINPESADVQKLLNSVDVEFQEKYLARL